VVGAIAAFAGCGGHFEVPTPASPSGAAIPPIEQATIVVPISIAMSMLRSRIDSLFPPADSLDRARCSTMGGLVCHQYVYRRDTLDLKMVNDRVSLYTRMHVRARVALPGVGGIASCGYAPEEMRRVEMQFATNLFWRTDWRLASRATMLAPQILDRCEITVLRVDATPLLRRVIDGQVAQLRQQFDSIVPAIADLKPAADSMWHLIQRPLALDSASTIWMSVSPEAVSLAPLVGTPTAVTTAISITARPRVSFGAQPAGETKPLPSLSLAGRVTGIHLPLEISVPFDDLSRRVSSLLAGEVAGKGISVRAIDIWGVGDSAVVKVDIQGRVSGALYLVGRVGYDNTSRSVLIQDLKYTLESASKMSSIKATLGAPRIRHALDEVTGHGHLTVGEQIDRLKSELGAELNRDLAPGVEMFGNVNDVRVDRFYANATAFVLRVVIDAQAQIAVH
jgi:hypothetical protein